MKVARCIAGFILIVVGIGSLGAQVAFLGIHPAVWFILGAALLLGDSAWEHLARKGGAQGETQGEAEATVPEGAVQEGAVPEGAASCDGRVAAREGAACYNSHPKNETREN